MNTSKVQLGQHGPSILPFALGCMGMGRRSFYGDNDESEGVATIHAALDQGVTLLDTGDFYSLGHNELLVGHALRGRRDQALLSVKFGALRAPDGAFVGYDCRPAALKNFLTHSLTRLGVDYIDIYRPSRLDPAVPIEETVGAIADMIKAGYVRYVSLSEVGAETIARAAAVQPIADLQIEYSLLSRSPENAIFPALKARGIGVTAYGVLSRGLLTGHLPTSGADFRSHLPRFTGDNATRNQTLAAPLSTMAEERGVTPAQLAIAWAIAKGREQGVTLVPLIGARTPAQLQDALGALSINLTQADIAQMEANIPAAEVAGTRYAPALMTHLDSER